MNLWGLDSSFTLVGDVPYLNLQWNRMYYEPGDFMVMIRAQDYNPNIKYLYSSDRPEVGVVNKIQTKRTVKGKFVLISGFFAEKLLDRRVFYPKFTRTNAPNAVAEIAVRNHQPDGFNISVIIKPLMGESLTFENLGDEVGSAIAEMLKTQEMAQQVFWDDALGTLRYRVWQGLDRTQAQNANAWAMFTDEVTHVTDFSLTEDDSDYKNFAYVLYGEEENPTLLEVDMRKDSTEPKRELLIQRYGSDQDAKELEQDAKEQLQEYAKIEKADIKVIQDGLIYLRDYDLGDKCDIINHELEKSYEARLIGVYEVFKENRHLVTLEFGEKIPTQYNKLNRLVRKTMRR